MKTIKLIIGIIIAVALICITACTQKTCPTYANVEVEDDCILFI